MNFYGNMPESYTVKINMENPLVSQIWDSREIMVDKTAEEVRKERDAEEAKKAEEAKAAGKEAPKPNTEPAKPVTHSIATKQELLHQVVDLALLANGMLKGKALADFIARSEALLK